MPARLGRARPFDAGAVHDLTAATTAARLLRWAGEDDGGPLVRRDLQRAWPAGNGCARTLSIEPKRPAQEEVPWLGDTTEEDVLNDNQLKHAGEP